jgi:hypothetical protein
VKGTTDHRRVVGRGWGGQPDRLIEDDSDDHRPVRNALKRRTVVASMAELDKAGLIAVQLLLKAIAFAGRDDLVWTLIISDPAPAQSSSQVGAHGDH